MQPEYNEPPENLESLDQDTHPEVRSQTMLDWVPIRKMFVDSYGRPLNQRKVNIMLRDFDFNALGTILLSYRPNDTYATLDGHHRKATAEQKGYTHMAARIYIDLTYEEEAALYNAFATVNRQTSLDRFRARLEAQEKEAMAIRGTLQRVGMDIALNGPAVGRVQAVSEMDRMYNEYGLEFLSQVVLALHDGWGKESRAWITESLRGFSGFWLRYRNLVDEKHLMDVMRLTPPDRIISLARNHQSLVGKGVNSFRYWGVALREIYNKGMRKNQLPEWQDIMLTDEERQRRTANLVSRPEMHRGRPSPNKQ